MARQLSSKSLSASVSVLALSVTAVIGSASVQPAVAQTGADGIYGGGSSLVSLAMRQIMDCYGNPVFPGSVSCGVSSATGLYAAVGSGNGFRGFISNNPSQFNLAYDSSGNVVTPATPPPFEDIMSGLADFNSYPYPRVDFGASDSPLAITSPATTLTTASFSFTPTNGWIVAGVTQAVASAAAPTAVYNSTSWGEPLQLPLVEAPVAIAINTNGVGGVSWNVKSKTSTRQAGGAIQLTTAQICAIFSGTVTDWNSTAPIAALNAAGAVVSQAFNDANIGSGGSGAPGTAAPYVNGSLPIVVVFRNDSSGTSFILTNYLKSACPQLTNGTNKYDVIFGKTNSTYVGLPSLPNNAFANLRTRIQIVTGNTTSNWVPADLSQGVAASINNVATSGATTYAGRIGYLSADFTYPYQLNSLVTYTPDSASVQNEDQRVAGTLLPASTSGGANPPTFIAPTPASADAAFQVLTGADIPTVSSAWSDWNLYGKNYPTTTIYGGVNISGVSKLGLPANVAGTSPNPTAAAYPIVGSAYAALYSCYSTAADAGRVVNVKTFFDWYYAPDQVSPPLPSVPATILANNGFSALGTTLRANAASVIATIDEGNVGACTGKSGAL